jgi:hypothetical protein
MRGSARFGLTELVSKTEIIKYASELARRLTDVVRSAGCNDATLQALDELNEAVADLIQFQQCKTVNHELERAGLRAMREGDIVIPIQKVR